jgi:hypothetical protein
MSEHPSLRARLNALRSPGEPVFEPSDDAVLVAFAQLFLDSGLYAFDADKHLRTDALTPLYDCETESQRSVDDEPERFVAIWAPVWERDDPVTGFRTGRDSAAFGSTPTIAMPQDERTAALLMLVTSSFVHLSAIQDQSGLQVRGALDAGDGYRFVTLLPSAVAAAESSSAPREDR